MADHSASAATKHEDGHGAHDAHGHEHHGDYMAHVKPYLVIGVLLFIFTVITVALSYIDFSKSSFFQTTFGWIGVKGHGINIFIGLVVATFKVCLVGAWFMHLKQEGSNIWRPLIFTFIFVAGLVLLSIFHYVDPIPTSSHWLH
jgi:caa(3)-type oxidase subunit IV